MRERSNDLLTHWKARADNLPRTDLHTELWSALLIHLADPSQKHEWIRVTEERFSSLLEEYHEAEERSTSDLERVAFTLLLDGIESWLEALDSLADGAATRTIRRLAEQGQRNLVAVQRLSEDNPSLAQRLMAWQ